MRLMTNDELVAVSGGELEWDSADTFTNVDIMGNYNGPGDYQDIPDMPEYTVEVTETRMTPEEKQQYDDEMAALALIIDNCAQGSPACIPGLWGLRP